MLQTLFTDYHQIEGDLHLSVTCYYKLEFLKKLSLFIMGRTVFLEIFQNRLR